VAQIVIGVLAITEADARAERVVKEVGAYLIAVGLLQGAFAWQRHPPSHAALGLAEAFAAVAAGGIMIVQRETAVQVLTLVVVGYFLARSVVTVLHAALRPTDRPSRIWLGLHLLVSLALATVTWIRWPLSGVRGLGMLVGIYMILDGLSKMMQAKSTMAHVETRGEAT
jgi:uncharacterized membrane protein HdeD (DUF308 family)